MLCNILIKLYKQIHLFEISFQLFFYDTGNNISFLQQKPIKFETQKISPANFCFFNKTAIVSINIELLYKILRKTFQINCNIFYHNLDERCCVRN